MNVSDYSLMLTPEEYRTVIEALRFYGDFLDGELQSIEATVAIPEAKEAAKNVLEKRVTDLNEVKARFNEVSVKILTDSAERDRKAADL